MRKENIIMVAGNQLFLLQDKIYHCHYYCVCVCVTGRMLSLVQSISKRDCRLSRPQSSTTSVSQCHFMEGTGRKAGMKEGKEGREGGRNGGREERREKRELEPHANYQLLGSA